MRKVIKIQALCSECLDEFCMSYTTDIICVMWTRIVMVIFIVLIIAIVFYLKDKFRKINKKMNKEKSEGAKGYRA